MASDPTVQDKMLQIILFLLTSSKFVGEMVNVALQQYPPAPHSLRRNVGGERDLQLGK